MDEPARSMPAAKAGEFAAVLFDLDDTLFPQSSWLAGAWSAVAEAAAPLGVDPSAFTRALLAVVAEGSDRGRIIDRALASIGASVPVGSLVGAFRSHRPARLDPYPGVRAALARLGEVARLGVVTDGDPGVQEAKLEALGLGRTFAPVVVSDRLGRRHRKPDPAPFQLALTRLGLPADRAVFVGDRPDKDVAGAQVVGMRTIRVRTGEYATAPDDPPAWLSVASVPEAAQQILGRLTVSGRLDTSRRTTRAG